MSLSTLAPADDFEAFEFAALVADLTQPLGEPEPRKRTARTVDKQQAIAVSQGIRRHRSNEREI